MSNSPVDLKVAVGKLDSLPAMPVIAQKIIGLDLASESGEKALLALLETDPQLSAKIIGLANTPLFGASKTVSSIQDAALILGITRIKSVTLGIVVMSSLVKKPAGKLNFQGLWQHSMAVAIALRTISLAMPRNMRPREDEMFLAGLLHDIGYLVLNHLDQDLSNKLHERFATEKGRISAEIEAEMLEMNHCELGGELARHWDLPDSIVAALRYHDEPDNESAKAGQPLVLMLNIAEKILSGFGIHEYAAAEIKPEDWLGLGIDPVTSDELVEKISKQADESKQTKGSALG